MPSDARMDDEEFESILHIPPESYISPASHSYTALVQEARRARNAEVELRAKSKSDNAYIAQSKEIEDALNADLAALRVENERLVAENHSLKGGIHDTCPDPYQKIRVLEARLSAFESVHRESSPEYRYRNDDEMECVRKTGQSVNGAWVSFIRLDDQENVSRETWESWPTEIAEPLAAPEARGEGEG